MCIYYLALMHSRELNKLIKKVVLFFFLLPDLFEDEAFTRVRINRLLPAIEIGFTLNGIIKQVDDVYPRYMNRVRSTSTLMVWRSRLHWLLLD